MVFAEVLELASLKQSLLSGHDKLDYSQMENKMRFHLVKCNQHGKYPQVLLLVASCMIQQGKINLRNPH